MGEFFQGVIDFLFDPSCTFHALYKGSLKNPLAFLGGLGIVLFVFDNYFFARRIAGEYSEKKIREEEAKDGQKKKEDEEAYKKLTEEGDILPPPKA